MDPMCITMLEMPFKLVKGMFGKFEISFYQSNINVNVLKSFFLDI